MPTQQEIDIGFSTLITEAVNEAVSAKIHEEVERATAPLKAKIEELSGEMVKPGKAAEYLGISRTTLTKYVQRGLPFHNIGGMRWFSKSEMNSWIKEQ
jgi:excisionase family DNA binding protein